MTPLTAAAAAILSALSPAPAADHTAPTRPAPLTITGPGVVLDWSASVDDHGPVRYEVTVNGRPAFTTTGTSFRYSSYPPPPAIFVFSVRAVDDAGNASAAAFQTLGRVWRGDELPEPPSAVRADTVEPGLVRLSWTPPEATGQLSVPPVAGYEVLLDGQPAGQLGDTSITLDVPANGRHTAAVRTLNAVDQLSAPAGVEFDTGP